MLDHASVAVRELARSRAFYEAALAPLGLTLLVAIALVEGNLTRQVQSSLPEEAPGFYFIDIQPDQAEAFEAAVRSVPGAGRIQRVPMLRGRIVALRGRPVAEWVIPDEVDWMFRGDRGITWSPTQPTNARLIAGDWWPEDYDGPPLLSLDAELGQVMGLEIGDSFTINVLGREIEAEIANFREIDWSTLSINFVMVFSPGLLARAPQTEIATVQAAPEAEAAIEKAVAEALPNVSAIRVKEALSQVGTLIGHLGTATRATAALALVAGVLVLGGAVAAGQRRRLYDTVVLKVLGATRQRIAGAFALEFGLVGLVSALLAGLVGTLAAYLVLTWVMELDFVPLPATVVLTALGAALLTAAIGLAGTWRALAQKAAPLLRNE